MSDTAPAPVYDEELDLSPEVLCTLLRRRTLGRSAADRHDRDDPAAGEPERASRRAVPENLYAAWL